MTASIAFLHNNGSHLVTFTSFDVENDLNMVFLRCFCNQINNHVLYHKRFILKTILSRNYNHTPNPIPIFAVFKTIFRKCLFILIVGIYNTRFLYFSSNLALATGYFSLWMEGQRELTILHI